MFWIIASKGPLSNPTTAAQPWRRELVLMVEGAVLVTWMGVRKGAWKSAMGISAVAWTLSTGERLVDTCGRLDGYEIARPQSLSAQQRHAHPGGPVRRAPA